jgi:hypothetical protein
MPEEKYGTRDLSYSAWHRAASIRRYVGWERAQLLTMCDADSVLLLEYSLGDKAPLCLIEAAADYGQEKPATAIAKLARRAGIPAFVVLYQRSLLPNPADRRWRDLRAFRIKRLWPKPENKWRRITPSEWAQGLVRIRAWSAKRLDMEAANDPFYEQAPEQGQLFAQSR